MTVLKFNYCDAKGHVSQRTLIQWTEKTTHIQGRMEEDIFPKTYRKDRVVEYLKGQELLLNDAAPPAPKPKAKPSPLDIATAAATARPDPKPTADGQNQIIFTGFNASLREDLEQKALDFGLRVMKTTGKTLTFLCYGDNAGPAKVERALAAGAFIIDSEQFLSMIQTGELP